jgi:hypothetical protein
MTVAALRSRMTSKFYTNYSKGLYKHHISAIMRFSPLTAILLPFTLISARSSSSQQSQIQVYLHPSPSSPHRSVPTLTPDQAKAVLTHHLGGVLSDFDEIPADEAMWGHLVGMWGGGAREKQDGRVVFVDGDVPSQGMFI